MNINNKTKLMYVCGPTIYNIPHIGNLRTFIWGDIIRKCLNLQGYKVKFCLNFTDIDDKIIQKCEEENIDFYSFISSKQIDVFNLLKHIDIINEKDFIPCTTNYLPEINYLINNIKDKYITNNSVFFNVDLNNYFKLGTSDDIKRSIFLDEEKNKKEDFALWKLTQTKPSWYSSFGEGRPAWHIECAVKMINCLNLTSENPLDYQIGGMDLKFPHHENTMCLLRTQNIKILNNLHVNYILDNEQKMSKSLNNLVYFDMGWDIKIFRLMCVYKSFNRSILFSHELLEEIKILRMKIIKKIETLPKYFDDKKFLEYLSRFNISGIIGLILSNKISQKNAINFLNNLNI